MHLLKIYINPVKNGRNVDISSSSLVQTGILSDCKMRIYRTTSAVLPTDFNSHKQEYTFSDLIKVGNYYRFTFTDTGLVNGTYYYAVSFYNTIGDNAGSSSILWIAGSAGSRFLNTTGPAAITIP